MRRRRFIAAGAGVGLGLLAGCSGSDSGTGGEGSDGGDATTTTGDGGAVGAFRLLISDQPAAIGDFDSLDVSFSRARIFRAGEATPETGTDGTETTAEPTETDDDGDDESETEADDEDEDEGGFVVRDLDGATVDLTDVVGDRAIGVLDGELEAGRYSKIELYAESVDGVVDGESVDVKIPSGKLQITKPFEVVAGDSVEFVFDINVVRKGNGGYNLLPVISESGVAGKDVDVSEVDGDDAEGEADEAGDSDEADDEEPEAGTTGP